MPNAVITDIAQAVTDTLTAATLSKDFTAARCRVAYYDTATETGLKLFVVGVKQAVDLTTGTRHEAETTHTVMVGIYQKVTRDGDGNVSLIDTDSLDYFTQQVIDLLRTNERQAGCVLKTVEDTGASADALEADDMYVTVVTLTYWSLR